MPESIGWQRAYNTVAQNVSSILHVGCDGHVRNIDNAQNGRVYRRQPSFGVREGITRAQDILISDTNNRTDCYPLGAMWPQMNLSSMAGGVGVLHNHMDRRMPPHRHPVQTAATQTESPPHINRHHIRRVNENLHPDRLLYFASALDLAGPPNQTQTGFTPHRVREPVSRAPPYPQTSRPGMPDSGITVFPMRSLPYFFHYLQNKFYFETYLWLYQNVMFHPRSSQTRLRMHHISQAWNVSLHDVVMATLSVHMMKYASLRQRTMHNVQSVLHEVSQGNASDEVLMSLRGLAVDVCIHLNPRQMLRDFCKLIRDLCQAVCGSVEPTSPGTRRRMRDRHPSNRQTESPERRAFQPPNMAARQVHPQMVPQPQQPQPRPQQHQQQQQHPVVIDVEQVNRRVPVSAPMSAPPYAIPVCSGQHHMPIPVCTTAHIPGCTSQPTWSIPACSMQIPCSIQHLPPCGLAQLPVGHHTLPPMLHPHHHPTTHPMQAHHHPHQQLHHQHHHHMTPTSQLLSQTHQVQPEEEVQQMLGDHRPGHPTYHQHLSNTIHQHHGPALSHPSPVLVQEPQIHPPPYPHELYGPYPRYPRRTTGRNRWRSIPPPPPPYPGFLLHFLAMLGNPPVPGTIGMDLHEDAREVENYEALLNLAERLGEAKPRGLTKSDIDKLPSYRFNPEMQRSDADQTSCVVCMCDFEVRQLLRVLPCSHEFHAKCVDKWLKTNRTCPICRADASEGISQSE